MPSFDGVELNPGVIGANIAASRRRRGINQADLAELVGISRPTLVGIESGKRAPSEQLLLRLAEALGERVRDIASLPPPDVVSLVRFRDPVRGNQSAERAVEELINFGRYFRHLETLSAKPRLQRYGVALPLEGANIMHAAEDLASAERAKLNLGDGPLPDLRALMEETTGMLVFGLSSLDEGIAGLFMFALDLPLVGFNLREADPRRQRWTMAHEYAHFLTNRYDAEVTYEPTNARNVHELFAERFAVNFLLPASGVSRRLSEMVGGKEQVTVSEVVVLADQFRVSFQAMCERLEEMGRVPRGTYAHVMGRGFRPLEAERTLGIDRKAERLSRYPSRYLRLLSRAWCDEKLSEGDVMTYLDVDRLAAREVLENFEARPGFPMDLPLGKNA